MMTEEIKNHVPILGFFGIRTDSKEFNFHSVECEGRLCYVVCSGDMDVVDVLAPSNDHSYIIHALAAYSVRLSEQGFDKMSVLISHPQPQIISLILDSFSVYSAEIQNGNLVIKINTNSDIYRNHVYSALEKQLLIDRSQNVSQEMRTAHFKTSKRLHGIRRKPLIGYPINGVVAGSLGAFPEFILPTFPCKKSMQGLCTPCFFSKVEMSDSNRDEIFKSFEIQTKYIVDNFDEQIIKCQLRSDPETMTLWDITFCFASNGSLFSDYETTKEGRFNAFKMLCDEISKRNLISLVYIETCAEDYLRFLDSDEANDLLPILKRLNIVVLCGFESAQAFTRDVLYTKSLDLSQFEQVVSKNNKLGFQTGAFLYAGFHSMTQSEIILDLIKSLCYLIELDAVPVIMIPKLHNYTMPDLLYRYGKYNIIDPITILHIAKITAWMTSSIKTPLRKDRWLMSDLLDDIPPSSTSFFNNKNKTSCQSCTTIVRDLLQEFRSSMDSNIFKEIELRISACDNNCVDNYYFQLNKEDEIRKEQSIYARTEANIDFALRKNSQYIHALGNYKKSENQLISSVKKELLCYGLNVDKKTLCDLRALNSSFGKSKFVHVAQIQLPDGSYVNVPVLEEYCKISMYTLSTENNLISLLRNGKEMFHISISPVPAWIDSVLSDGTNISNIISVHGKNTLALVRNNECYYKKIGLGCKYCSSDEYCDDSNEKFASPAQIAEAVSLALSNGSNYSLALSGGAIEPPDRGAIYFSTIAKSVLAISPNIGISVEIAPPASNDYIDTLIGAGIKSLIMNLEFYNDSVRRKYCPGKIEISKERYFEALSYAVSKLSPGRVSSVLIAGLESIEATIEGAKKMLSIGVVPTIIPFRPYDNCEMRDYPVTNPMDLFEIERQLSKYLSAVGSLHKHPYGCLSCNACIGIELNLAYKGCRNSEKGGNDFCG